MEANGARWPSRSSKPVAARPCGGRAGSTPRRRQPLAFGELRPGHAHRPGEPRRPSPPRSYRDEREAREDHEGCVAVTISDRGSLRQPRETVVLQRLRATAAPQSRNWSAVNVPVATPTGTAPTACARCRAAYRQRRGRLLAQTPAFRRRCPLKCDGHEGVAVRRVVSEGATGKVAPESNRSSLIRAPSLKFPVSSARYCTSYGSSRSSSVETPGSVPLAFARLEDLLAQMLHVARAEAAEQIVIGLVPQPRQRVTERCSSRCGRRQECR